MSEASDETRFGTAWAMACGGKDVALITDYPVHAISVLKRWSSDVVMNPTSAIVDFRRQHRVSFTDRSGSIHVVQPKPPMNAIRGMQYDHVCFDPDTEVSEDAARLILPAWRAAVPRDLAPTEADRFRARMRRLRT